MGIYGTVVIHPNSPAKATTDSDRKATAMSVIKCLVDLNLLQESGAEQLRHDDGTTMAIGQHIEGKQPKGLKWIHYAIEPEHLTPAIGELVYCDTAKVWWGEKDRKKRDLIAIPYVDVTVFSKVLPFHDHDGQTVFDTNTLLEFSYEDARLSPEVHSVRDPKHKLFRSLQKALGSKISWGVVSG